MNPKRTFTDDEAKLMREMRADGASFRRIGEAVNASHDRVGKFFRSECGIAAARETAANDYLDGLVYERWAERKRPSSLPPMIDHKRAVELSRHGLGVTRIAAIMRARYSDVQAVLLRAGVLRTGSAING